MIILAEAPPSCWDRDATATRQRMWRMRRMNSRLPIPRFHVSSYGSGQAQWESPKCSCCSCYSCCLQPAQLASSRLVCLHLRLRIITFLSTSSLDPFHKRSPFVHQVRSELASGSLATLLPACGAPPLPHLRPRTQTLSLLYAYVLPQYLLRLNPGHR